MDCIHLENSHIKFGETNTAEQNRKFIKELNNIHNFYKIFKEWELTIYKSGESYELLIDDDGQLIMKEILTIITDMVKLSKKYNNQVKLTLKIFDNGIFLAYLIIVDNHMNEISQEVNKLMKTTEIMIGRACLS